MSWRDWFTFQKPRVELTSTTVERIPRAQPAPATKVGDSGPELFVPRTPRGIRNHNPGNLRRGTPWVGLSPTQTDPDFWQFTAPVWGLRALARLLLNYEAWYGLNTVRKIIARYAPESENNTDAYAQAVASALGVGPDDLIHVRERLPELVPAIVKHENGMQPYSAELIAEAIAKV